MNFKLPDTIASSQDVTTLAAELRSYYRWFIHESIKQRVSGKHSEATSPTISSAAQELLQELEKRKALNQRGLEDLIKTLETYATNAPSILFTLAAPVTNGVRTTLVAWCRRHIAENILVTFSHNSSLLGGMVLRYKSRVFDWSLRRQLLEKSSTFVEVLRRV